MLEQQLINAFMKLTAKAGAGDLVRELVQTVDHDGNPKVWSQAEMAHAIDVINMQIERFDRRDAVNVIHTLLKKFEISPDELIHQKEDSAIEQTGVKGLQ